MIGWTPHLRPYYLYVVVMVFWYTQLGTFCFVVLIPICKTRLIHC